MVSINKYNRVVIKIHLLHRDNSVNSETIMNSDGCRQYHAMI